ncbi:Putative glycoside hydrolase Family 18, chitinase_18 [Mucilaginibacter lappiensis]|uniref:mannosyl-glycoprotein endo-beta-N-acetylglucosaminidase n=1 Tax=Mucilaginibacter lappiensis TaxID=354630 RepID=A0ABR6PEY3_9SPHI|nr:LamG-like jellyroll fold domain-containing protein [Mucilaginibacter lappiensis]MBB6108332.1 hypothetical protein [Mucilaginibacter lappiensis]SIQ41990.1 Putative glycoside hydrolase Family 18, chitinase_18 [Mucilaginibacter lappiensis]
MKKNIFVVKTWLFMLCPCVIAGVTSCKKDIHNGTKQPAVNSVASHLNVTSTNADLIAYKNSAHQLMVGYYRTWGDKTVSGDVNGPAMTDMPDSVDIISNFTDYTPPSSPYWPALKNTYIPALHAKGTKIVNTQGLPNTTSDTSYTNHYTNNSTGYAAWALATYNSYNATGYDGIDLDVESIPSGATLTADVGLMSALSQYFGPKATTGKLLILDTNEDGTSSFFRQVSTFISYLYQQAYWRQTSSLTGTFNTYSAYIRPNQFIPIVDFEDGSGDGQNSSYVYNPVQIYQYASWQPTQGTKGGVGSYGIDNEYYQIANGVHNIYTRQAIQMMNPPQTTSSTNAVSLSSGKISAGDVTQLKSAAAFTLESWVYFNAIGSWNNILAKSNTSTDRIALQTGGGDNSLYVILGNGSNSYGYTAANAVSAGQWYHVAVVFDGTQSTNASKLKLYINGTLQTLTFSGTIPASTSSTNTAAFLAGSETTTSTNTYLSGKIDEIRVWNAALNQSTISAWMNKSLGTCHPNASNLKLYWQLDNAAINTTAVASLGTTYAGTITNGVYTASTQASTASGCP